MNYDDVWSIENPTKRIEALKARSRELHQDFLTKPPVRAIRTFDQISFPFLMDIAFWRANFAKNNPLRSPGILKPIAANIDYRMYLIEDASGLRILFNPLISDMDQIGIYHFFKARFQQHASVEEHLKEVGLTPSDIDVIVIDHLHLQNLVNLVRVFPKARFLVQERELLWAQNLHPVDELFFCKGGSDLELETIRGAQSVGESMAVIPTPGHTAGHQSLVIRLPEGVATLGENGLCIDNYHPQECGINGVAQFARDARQEVIPIANTFWSAQAQYDSMILEKHLASPYMTYTSASFSDSRPIPAVLGFNIPMPKIKRFTPRLRMGTFSVPAPAALSRQA